jgi:hypothetical protein
LKKRAAKRGPGVEKDFDGFQIATQPRMRKLTDDIWERGPASRCCAKSQPSKGQKEGMATPTTRESRPVLNNSLS